MSKREGPDTAPEPKRARTNETVEIPKRTLAAILPYLSDSAFSRADLPDELWADLYTTLPLDTIKKLLPQVNINHYAWRIEEKQRRMEVQELLNNLAPTKVDLSEDLNTFSVTLGESFSKALGLPANVPITLRRSKYSVNATPTEPWKPFDSFGDVLYAVGLESTLSVSFLKDIKFAKERKMLKKDAIEPREDDDETHFYFATRNKFFRTKDHDSRVGLRVSVRKSFPWDDPIPRGTRSLTVDVYNEEEKYSSADLPLPERLGPGIAAITDQLYNFGSVEFGMKLDIGNEPTDDQLVLNFEKFGLLAQQFDPPLNEPRLNFVRFEGSGEDLTAVFESNTRMIINSDFWRSGQYESLYQGDGHVWDINLSPNRNQIVLRIDRLKGSLIFQFDSNDRCRMQSRFPMGDVFTWRNFYNTAKNYPEPHEIAMKLLWRYGQIEPEEVVNAAASRRQDLLGM